jgi:hypothetical protein
MTEAEPGIYRYSASGKLLKVLGSELKQLVLDTTELVARYGEREELTNRYAKLINLQPTVEDLVSTPLGLAVLVRVAGRERIGWQLWYVEQAGRPRTVLLPGRVGPLGHMRCEARDARMACVGSFPRAEDAGKERPQLLIYDLK